MGYFHPTDEQRAWLQCQIPEWAARSESGRSMRDKLVEECTQTFIQRWGLPEAAPTEKKLREKIYSWLKSTCNRQRRKIEKQAFLSSTLWKCAPVRYDEEQRKWLKSLIPAFEESGARHGDKTRFAYKCAETYIQRWGLPKTTNGEELAEGDFQKRIRSWFHNAAALRQVSSAQDLHQQRAPCTSDNSRLPYPVEPHFTADIGCSSNAHTDGPAGLSSLTPPQRCATSSISGLDESSPPLRDALPPAVSYKEDPPVAISHHPYQTERPRTIRKELVTHIGVQLHWLTSQLLEYDQQSSGATLGDGKMFVDHCAETFIKTWGPYKTANGEEMGEDVFKKKLYDWFEIQQRQPESNHGQVSSDQDRQPQHLVAASSISQLPYQIEPPPTGGVRSLTSVPHTLFSGLTLATQSATSSASGSGDVSSTSLKIVPLPTAPYWDDPAWERSDGHEHSTLPSPLQLPGPSTFGSSQSAFQTPVPLYSPRPPSPQLNASTPPAPIPILLDDEGHGILIARKLVELASGRELQANEVAAEIVASAIGTGEVVEALFVAAGWVLDASRSSSGSTLPKQDEPSLREPQRGLDSSAMDGTDEYDPDVNVSGPPLFPNRPTSTHASPTLEDLLSSFVRVLSHLPSSVKSEVLFELHETFRRRSVALISVSSQWSDTNTDSDRKHSTFAQILSTALSLPSVSLFRDEVKRDVWIVFARVLVSVLPKGAEAEAGWVAGVYILRALVQLKVNARASSDYEPKCRWEKEMCRVYEDRWLKMRDVRLQVELAEVLDWLRGALRLEALAA